MFSPAPLLYDERRPTDLSDFNILKMSQRFISVQIKGVCAGFGRLLICLSQRDLGLKWTYAGIRLQHIYVLLLDKVIMAT